jgi:hypothetical protein
MRQSICQWEATVIALVSKDVGFNSLKGIELFVQ